MKKTAKQGKMHPKKKTYESIFEDTMAKQAMSRSYNYPSAMNAKKNAKKPMKGKSPNIGVKMKPASALKTC